MGRRKTILKIPKRARLKCPLCSEITQLEIPQEGNSSPQFFECKKCAQKIPTPMARCCVICAFSKKKCLPSLKLEAFSKGLELR